MANVINRTVRDSDGNLLRVNSVNTPDYSTSTWIINPDLSGVSSVAEYYWKTSGDTVIEMTTEEKNAVDVTRLSSAKTVRKEYLVKRAEAIIEERYNGYEDIYQTLYSDSNKAKPKKSNEIQKWVNWIQEISSNISEKVVLVDQQASISAVNAIELDEAQLLSQDPGVGITGIEATQDDGTLDTFLDANSVVTDSYTNISGPFYLMQMLTHRKEIYNDSDNPLYDPSHTPILGSTGILQDHSNRVSSLETIHGKLGWHQQEVYKSEYDRPKNVLFYYGYPNSYNSAVNQWNNEAVAQDMARYSLIVLGDGVQDPTHPDYSNTQVIIPRVKALNANAKIFGYVTADQTLGTFQTKASQWDTLQVHGIFLDEAGYDFGRTRDDFNDRVDYVHGLTYATLAFANAWDPRHILGTENDSSYPNSTYNSSLDESNLTSSDWILLESFPVNTLSYSSNDGYEDVIGWRVRGQRMQSLRNTYGVNFAGVSVINNDNVNGQNLFDFGYLSAAMWCLEAYGTSDIYYGASSAQVKFWTRPYVKDLGHLWNLSACIGQDAGDTGIYHRYYDHGKISLGWVSAGETGAITTW